MDQEMVSKAFADMLLQQITALQNTIASLQSTIEKLNAAIEEKNQIILNQNRNRFGQKSEQTVYVLRPDGQISLFDPPEGISDEAPQEAQTSSAKPAEEKQISVSAHTRKPKRTMEDLISDLPTEEVLCDLPENERVNAQGEQLKCIGREFVRTEICKKKAEVTVKKIYRLTYVDPRTEAETGYADIRKAPTPAPLLQHSYASASVVTDVMIRKYIEAMPLYRQEQSWQREFHLNLKRGTMANWVILTADQYLRIFWEKFLTELLSQNVIHADETVLQVLKEPERKPTEESRMWVYASAKRAAHQIRLFRYEASRAGACAESMLKGFHGVLVADGYSGYNLVSDVTRAGCWAHMRRKWHEAMPKNATPANSKAAVGFQFCTRLFEAERELEQLPTEERLHARQGTPRKIVEDYYAWLDTLFNPTGKLRTAVIYARKQKPYLCAFLEHGEIEISNNQVENAIRPLVVGRKNWLFSATPEGAEASAIAYSFMETAKANGLNVEEYLLHVLTVLPDRFAKNPNVDVEDLMPWTVEMQKRFQG